MLFYDGSNWSLSCHVHVLSCIDHPLDVHFQPVFRRNRYITVATGGAECKLSKR
jgi:hypothetical protein